MSPSSVVLRLHGVTRVHGEGATRVEALRGVSFAAHAGELVAVMGPSGSGKSTLLTIAGGLDQPTEGRVEVEGTDLVALPQAARSRLRRTSIGYVFQGFNLIPALSAAENVALPLELDGTRTRAAVLAGAAGYLALPALRARDVDVVPGTWVRVPVVVALKDVAKAAGCLRGLLGRATGDAGG